MASWNGDCSELENLLRNNQQEQETTPAEDHFIIQISEQSSRVVDVAGEGINHLGDNTGSEGSNQPSQASANSTVLQAFTDTSEDNPLASSSSTDANLAQQESTVNAVEEGAHHPAISFLLNGVTFDSEEDSALHVVAAAGDTEQYVKCAEMIYGEATHLLDATNKNGDTPLHRAATAGNLNMVSRLMALAENKHGGRSMKSLLSKTNKAGEAVLHCAIRGGNIDVINKLLSKDPELGRVPNEDTSPLFLAISLRRLDIAAELFQLCSALSYSGPGGQNIVHIAVFQDKGPTSLLIEANKSSLFQPDKMGSYPIHVAAAAGRVKSVVIILERFPSCATLRDGRGRAFLHVAVEKKKWVVVAFACQSPQFESILNMQDSEGNSALCLAVEAGDQWIFNCLFQNHRVLLDLSNKNGVTAHDLADLKIPGQFYFSRNPRSMILRALQFANAAVSDSRPDHMHGKDTRIIDEDKESEKLTNASQVMGVVSVLVATVTFAAAFTLPGGYRADDHDDAGTPTLSGSYAFDAFVISVALAFICSLLATVGLIFSGFASVDYSVRGRFSDRSKLLLHSSVRSLAVAFAIAIYLVMAPVALKTAIAVCIIICIGLLYQNWAFRQDIILANTIRKRFGIWEALGCSIFDEVFQNFFFIGNNFRAASIFEKPLTR
ncbi:unnamed protein product [Urochloa decumbens]|uniref:PGG domain-containing protein n=1 Tax=Urochloa decumbens TaxID=240449 RepID=A0ABC9BC35_9POAL